MVCQQKDDDIFVLDAVQRFVHHSKLLEELRKPQDRIGDERHRLKFFDDRFKHRIGFFVDSCLLNFAITCVNQGLNETLSNKLFFVFRPQVDKDLSCKH